MPSDPQDIRMGTAKPFAINDITMSTAKIPNDVHMETAKAGLTLRQGAMKGWERELLNSPEVKRKATVAQLCVFNSAYSRVQLMLQQISLITTFKPWDTLLPGGNEEPNLTRTRMREE
jgi:hypothetical protein